MTHEPWEDGICIVLVPAASEMKPDVRFRETIQEAAGAILPDL